MMLCAMWDQISYSQYTVQSRLRWNDVVTTCEHKTTLEQIKGLGYNIHKLGYDIQGEPKN